MYYIEFGKILRMLRQERKLSQSTLAALIGSSKAVISKYENSMSYPPYDALIKIARVFKVSTDFLLGLDKAAGEENAKILDIDNLTNHQVDTLIAIAEEYRSLNRKQQREICNKKENN